VENDILLLQGCDPSIHNMRRTSSNRPDSGDKFDNTPHYLASRHIIGPRFPVEPFVRASSTVPRHPLVTGPSATRMYLV